MYSNIIELSVTYRYIRGFIGTNSYINAPRGTYGYIGESGGTHS